MSVSDYEIHINRSLYDALWEGDDQPEDEGYPDDLDKIVAEELSAARRKQRRKAILR